jgi:hypothetical protein
MHNLWLKGATFLALAMLLPACASSPDDNKTTATTWVSPPVVQMLKIVPRPSHIVDLMQVRGEQDAARLILRIISPQNGESVDGPSVNVKLTMTGDLKGYLIYQDPTTGMGNHIHLILDNRPYEEYYDLASAFKFNDVEPGPHTLRAFASRPWHESYKNEGAFQMVSFTVRGKVGAAGGSPGNVDPSTPLLTYSRPKGEYKGEESEPIMIDFWLSNAKLKGDGGAEQVRYIIDDDEPRYVDKWEPVWLSRWISGKHSVRLELLGADQWPIQNGEFNVTTREIFVTRP